MRPLHLKISGFGPYAGCTEIPMEELGSQGLYLITGDTGAGKTTIFDAICYALFGKASGEVRDESMLRSKYASPDTPTEVELRFSHAGKEYRIRRNPKYMRPAKRGGGETWQQPAVELYKPDGSTVTQTKTVLAEVEGLLGVNKEQFSQISMLAQGDFLKLLLADTGTRLEIFRKLFKTEKYLTFQKRLGAAESELAGQLKDGRKSIDQYISGIQADKDDVLSIEVEKAVADEMTTEAVLELLDKLIGQDQERKEKLDHELESIKADLDKVNASIGAAQALKKAEEELAQAKEELALEEPKYEGLTIKKEEARKALEKKPEHEKAAALIEAELEDYDKAIELEKKTERLSEEIQSKKGLLEKEEADKKALQEKLEELKKEQEALKDAGADLEKIRSEIKSLRDEAEKIEELAEALKNLAADTKRLKELQDDYLKKDAVFRKLNEDYDAKDRAFRDGQAGILAEKLREGEKCPVCGSLTHPEPACRKKDVPTEKELEEAKKQAEEARGIRDEASKKAHALDTGICKKREELKGRCLKELGTEDTEEAEKKAALAARENKRLLKEKTDREKAAAEGLARKQELDKRIPEKEEELKQLTEKTGGSLIEIGGKETEKKAVQEQLDELKKSLRYENKKKALEEAESLRKLAKELQAVFDGAQKDLEEQKGKIDRLKSAIDTNAKLVSEGKTEDLPKQQEQKEKLDKAQKECIDRKEEVTGRIRTNEKIRENIRERAGVIKETETKLQWVKALSDTANGSLRGKEKIQLETYIQTTYFDRIIRRANLRLMTMSSGQYELTRMKEAGNNQSQSGLDLGVIDHYNGTERSVKTLSGGESFMASLSLALGLSDEVQSSAGGIRIDTMFVDEGFGSLDPDSLDQAYKALAGLADGKRLVGIISHVAGLKEKIDKKIIVTKKRDAGSFITLAEG